MIGTTVPTAKPPGGAPLERLVMACAAGRFVPHFRNRAIGRETARLSVDARGRLCLRSETEITVNRFNLHQRLEARFDAGLRPEWCIVRAKVNSQPMTLELEIDGAGALLRSRDAGGARTVSRILRHPPLLLPDNAFAAHALAALGALRAAVPVEPAACGAGPAAFTALPSCEVLEAAAPGRGGVLLGGHGFPPPAITLRLTPDLDEHAWIDDGWVERLMVPQAQMRVDWIRNESTKGESS